MPRKPSRAPERAPDFERGGRTVPKALFPTGRVRFSLGTTDRREIVARRRELDRLVVWRAWDVLRALAAGALDVGDVVAAVKAEGEGALAQLRVAAGAVGRGVPTLAEERDRYLEWYARERKDRSRIQVTSRLKRALEQTVPGGGTLGGRALDQATRGDIEAALHAVSPAPGTQNGLRAALSGLYSWSITEEAEAARAASRPPRWSVNPAALVDQRETHARTATATPAQARALLVAAEIHQAAYVRAFLHLGLRKDELIHTRLHLDLDTERWTWRIQPRAPDKRCGCPQCRGRGWSPKVKRSHRLLPVRPAELRAALSEYLEAYPCEPGDFVFRNPSTGRVWDEGKISGDFRRLCQRAEVRYGRDEPGGLVIHDLRATCATELDRAGVSLKVIATLLGDSADTVMNKYLRVKMEELADGIERGPTYSTEAE